MSLWLLHMVWDHDTATVTLVSSVRDTNQVQGLSLTPAVLMCWLIDCRCSGDSIKLKNPNTSTHAVNWINWLINYWLGHARGSTLLNYIISTYALCTSAYADFVLFVLFMTLGVEPIATQPPPFCVNHRTEIPSINAREAGGCVTRSHYCVSILNYRVTYHRCSTKHVCRLSLQPATLY